MDSISIFLIKLEKDSLQHLWFEARVEECQTLSINEFNKIKNKLPIKYALDCLASAARGENWDLFFYIAQVVNIRPELLLESCIQQSYLKGCERVMQIYPSVGNIELICYALTRSDKNMNDLGINLLNKLHKEDNLYAEDMLYLLQYVSCVSCHNIDEWISNIIIEYSKYPLKCRQYISEELDLTNPLF
jgi:hypothetical protein